MPDCSNMCHEPTSVGLPESIGIGKGTVVLDDFERADAIFILGQNPGTNSPRMMTELHNASRRGAPIIVFNPLKERALQRFAAPQDPIEMATFGSTRGVDDLTQVARPLPRVGTGIKVSIGAVHRALDALPAWQLANRETGAVHAAAWATRTGEVVLAREDVGRHNALDKLIGAMARGRIDPEAGFAVITSRCSFEMVQKAATIGIPTLVAISAPTTMALHIAERTGVTLIALARSDSVTLYANPGRIEEMMAKPELNEA
jgi:formate dehydrogenase accessory protein FdhD